MITNESMDKLFHALAHEIRRSILDIVRDKPGLGVGELAKHFDVSRIAVMNHLSVLSQAGLIISGKEGRTRCLYLNVAPIQMIYDRWTDDYSRYWAERMTSIKYNVENALNKRNEK